MTTVRPALDPIAHRATLDALEAQRAAYQRYARTVETQRAALGDGDGDRAAAVTDAAVRGFDELETGARHVARLVEQVTRSADPETAREMRRQLDQLLTEARAAGTAIQNMTLQLEAWRDAYGRQLAEVGLTPGGAPAAEDVDAGRAYADRAAAGYGRPGRAGDRAHPPSLIDRKG